MLVRMGLMKDNELYKRDWEIEGLVNFIGKHESRAGYNVAPPSINKIKTE